MTESTEALAKTPREAAYAAVYAAGWLTDNAWVNGHIWHSVEAALDAAGVEHGCGE
jgi:hypothetical protein